MGLLWGVELVKVRARGGGGRIWAAETGAVCRDWRLLEVRGGEGELGRSVCGAVRFSGGGCGLAY